MPVRACIFQLYTLRCAALLQKRFLAWLPGCIVLRSPCAGPDCMVCWSSQGQQFLWSGDHKQQCLIGTLCICSTPGVICYSCEVRGRPVGGGSSVDPMWPGPCIALLVQVVLKLTAKGRSGCPWSYIDCPVWVVDAVCHVVEPFSQPVEWIPVLSCLLTQPAPTVVLPEGVVLSLWWVGLSLREYHGGAVIDLQSMEVMAVTVVSAIYTLCASPQHGGVVVTSA